MLPEISCYFIDLVLNDDYYQAYIIDAPFGFHNHSLKEKTFVERLEEKMKDNKIVLILTKAVMASEHILKKLISLGAIVNTEITRTAAVAKMGFLLGNVI